MSDCCKTEIETYEMIYIYVCMYKPPGKKKIYEFGI